MEIEVFVEGLRQLSVTLVSIIHENTNGDEDVIPGSLDCDL